MSDEAAQSPSDHSFDQVIVERRSAARNPHVREVFSSKLKEGPRSGKSAVVWEIVDNDGEHHHYTLKLDSFKRSKSRGWQLEEERSFSLGTTEEIAALHAFIGSILKDRLPSREGEYVVLAAGERTLEVSRLLGEVDTSEKITVVRRVIEALTAGGVTARELAHAMDETEGRVLGELTAAAKLLEYSRALEGLRSLIAEPSTLEAEFQKVLSRNPWMFGSEYSELLPRRTWTRDDTQDFMLRRTVDGCLELIEIKRPFSEDLLRYDGSHDSWYPSAALSQAMGQAARYVEQIERKRDSILASDHEEVAKIRARIIIGRDGEGRQKQALRVLNGHLHRMEVLTFDQLLRIAERVLSVFRAEAGREPADELDPVDDLPF